MVEWGWVTSAIKHGRKYMVIFKSDNAWALQVNFCRTCLPRYQCHASWGNRGQCRWRGVGSVSPVSHIHPNNNNQFTCVNIILSVVFMWAMVDPIGHIYYHRPRLGLPVSNHTLITSDRGRYAFRSSHFLLNTNILKQKPKRKVNVDNNCKWGI